MGGPVNEICQCGLSREAHYTMGERLPIGGGTCPGYRQKLSRKATARKSIRIGTRLREHLGIGRL
jgi:hypothetical protein